MGHSIQGGSWAPACSGPFQPRGKPTPVWPPQPAQPQPLNGLFAKARPPTPSPRLSLPRSLAPFHCLFLPRPVMDAGTCIMMVLGRNGRTVGPAGPPAPPSLPCWHAPFQLNGERIVLNPGVGGYRSKVSPALVLCRPAHAPPHSTNPGGMSFKCSAIITPRIHPGASAID